VSLTYSPPAQHFCTPGWEVGDEVIEGVGRVMVEVFTFAPNGTVIRCGCGRTYVAFTDTRPSGGWVNLGVQWRAERRIERWRRERRARETQ